VTLRRWLASAVIATSPVLAGSSALAADPVIPAPTYSFSTLRAVPADVAKTKLEAWLKSINKLDAKKLDSIWSNASRSVSERTQETIVLGLPEAAKLLQDAKNADVLPPSEVPALLKDAKLDPFVKANLAAGYAKHLASKRVYEESLEATKGIAPELLVDPAGFFFFKSVAEYSLILREPAINSIIRLMDDVTDTPDRYKVVATLMFFEIQNWSKDEKDLANIGRLMDNSGRRLDLARGGAKTQDIQKKIVFRLDEKIKELEQQQKKKGGG